MIALAVFFAVFAVLGFNWWHGVGKANALAGKLGGQRLLGRGNLAIETADYILDIVTVGWRVEVPRLLLGRRMILTLAPVLPMTGTFTTGFSDVDGNFRLAGDDPDLTRAVFADVTVREALRQMRELCRLRRIDITAGEKLVVLFRRRRRVSEREALASIVAFAGALNAVADVRVTARAAQGRLLRGATGGGSGAPVAMPTGT